MARAILLTLAIVICGQATFIHPINVIATLSQQKSTPSIYWKTRQELMMDEKRQSLGGELELNPIEARANQVLMRAKSREIYDGLILSLAIASFRD